ncbi:hypothetical protein chiPu_0031410 [Chiloscyllium punctatum]|uniref:Uncharacterized protein n=1 Tax=Chiloscyllium punctatum TaxID=137246 RepID=A0A401TWD5_CHIPU|nr:hypothetical protein [Chiloscyllium punctatum]
MRSVLHYSDPALKPHPTPHRFPALSRFSMSRAQVSSLSFRSVTHPFALPVPTGRRQWGENLPAAGHPHSETTSPELSRLRERTCVRGSDQTGASSERAKVWNATSGNARERERAPAPKTARGRDSTQGSGQRETEPGTPPPPPFPPILPFSVVQIWSSLTQTGPNASP